MNTNTQRPVVLVRWRRGIAIASLAAVSALAGCVVAPVQPRYVGETVMVAPPQQQQEVYGVAPMAGYVWLGGYWNWSGGRHVWVGGHWAPPRPGYDWEPHAWVRSGAGWHLREGHWARR